MLLNSRRILTSLFLHKVKIFLLSSAELYTFSNKFRDLNWLLIIQCQRSYGVTIYVVSQMTQATMMAATHTTNRQIHILFAPCYDPQLKMSKIYCPCTPNNCQIFICLKFGCVCLVVRCETWSKNLFRKTQ